MNRCHRVHCLLALANNYFNVHDQCVFPSLQRRIDPLPQSSTDAGIEWTKGYSTHAHTHALTYTDEHTESEN